jgi:hypothetical protein
MAESERSAQLFTDKLYNKLKFVALVLLPAVGTLYFALAGIWGLPNAEKIIGSITAFDTFLGIVLHLSTNQYYKNGQNFDGTLNVTDEQPPQLLVQLNSDPNDLPGKHSVEFNVNTVKS